MNLHVDTHTDDIESNSGEIRLIKSISDATIASSLKFIMIASALHPLMSTKYRIYAIFATSCVVSCIFVCAFTEIDQTRSYRGPFFYASLVGLHITVLYVLLTWRRVLNNEHWKWLMNEALWDDTPRIALYIKCIRILYWIGAIVITCAIYAGWDAPILLSLAHPVDNSTAGRVFLWIHGIVLTILIWVWVLVFEGIIVMFAFFSLACMTRLRALREKWSNLPETARSTPHAGPTGIRSPLDDAKQTHKSIQWICGEISYAFVTCYWLFTMLMASGWLNRVWAWNDPSSNLASVSRWNSAVVVEDDSAFHIVQDCFYIIPSFCMQTGILFFSALLTSYADEVVAVAHEERPGEDCDVLASMAIGYYVFRLRITWKAATVAYIVSLGLVAVIVVAGANIV